VLPGCCRVLPGCRVPVRTSSQLVWALRLPGCRVAGYCRVLPGTAGYCRVAGCCRGVAGCCRVRLPGCRGQGSRPKGVLLQECPITQVDLRPTSTDSESTPKIPQNPVRIWVDFRDDPDPPAARARHPLRLSTLTPRIRQQGGFFSPRSLNEDIRWLNRNTPTLRPGMYFTEGDIGWN
jgi:hypothetical protein